MESVYKQLSGVIRHFFVISHCHFPYYNGFTKGLNNIKDFLV